MALPHPSPLWPWSGSADPSPERPACHAQALLLAVPSSWVTGLLRAQRGLPSQPLPHVNSYLIPLSLCHFLAQCPTPPPGMPSGKGGPCWPPSGLHQSPQPGLACRQRSKNTCSGNVGSTSVMLDLEEKVGAIVWLPPHLRKEREEEEDRKGPSQGRRPSHHLTRLPQATGGGFSGGGLRDRFAI